MNVERMAWSGTCEHCSTIVVVAAHHDTINDYRTRISAGPDEWDGHSDCPVCDGYMNWVGSDPTVEVLLRG